MKLKVLALTAAILAGLPVQAEERVDYLLSDMDAGPLKERLTSCAPTAEGASSLSIGHRGAPLGYPEHTEESYQAAAAQGAGRLECDVTFTRDEELVCRHSQCDLHRTTDILLQPDLAAKCSVTWEAGGADGVQCCASDFGSKPLF